MRFALSRALLLFLILLTSVVRADEDATVWLERMSQAVHNHNYVGTFVYMQEGRLESMKLVHAVDDAGERERLVSLSGPSREVIRERGQVTCYLPEKDALVAKYPHSEPGFPYNLPTHWEQVHKVYEFKVLERSRIAGLNAQHIAIVPQDAYRYGHNYWISTEHDLLLRADIVNENGEVVEQLEFTSMMLMDKVPPQMLQPESGTSAVELPSEQSQANANNSQPMHWRVTGLPKGFELELQRQHAIVDNGIAVEHLVYSDGLASVSVFIEPKNSDDEASEGLSRRGSVNAYTRLMEDKRVTVLGEVPLVTVKQIGDSISPLDNSQ
jgi:sigma-E factor negative regulatory protein RseB